MALDMKIHNGWLQNVTHIPSPHHDERPENVSPSLLVIHNISLPPGQLGGLISTNFLLEHLIQQSIPFSTKLNTFVFLLIV